MTVPAAPGVPDALRDFILSVIDSVDACEVLLALHAAPERSWSAKELGRTLKLPLGVVQSHLETLTRRHLLDVRLANDLRYRFAPARTDVRALIGMLGALHRASPAVVSDIISSR